MSKIVSIKYIIGDEELFDAPGLLEFFKTLFAYFETENRDPEQYCNDESFARVGWDSGYITDAQICDFIAAGYESMSLWHDGKRGYQLLSLLGLHYSPGPMGSEGDDSVLDIMTEVFDEHFAAGGTV